MELNVRRASKARQFKNKYGNSEKDISAAKTTFGQGDPASKASQSTTDIKHTQSPSEVK